MKVYTNKFQGQYLTGSAVIVAPDAATAASLLTEELATRGLPGAREADMFLLQTDTPEVTILDDGDY